MKKMSDKAKVLKNTKITLNADNEDKKEYPSVGEFDLTIK